MNDFAPRLTRRTLIGSAVAAAACTVRANHAASAAATAMTTTRTSAAQAGSNIQASHDAFSSHLEPYIAVNPRNPRNLLIASRAKQGTALGLATYASFDGGANWRSNGPLPGFTPDFDANPTIAFDPRGRGFVCAVVGDRQQQGNALVWRTDDGGRTFHPPVTAAAGYLDHPGLAADPTPRPSGMLYLTGSFYNNTVNGLVFSRSSDSGRTFEQPRAIDPQTGTQGRVPVITAGPDGAVHLMYYVAASSGTGLAKVVSSTDRGATFAAPVTLPVHIAFPPQTGKVMTRSGPALAAAPDGSSLYAAAATYDATTGTCEVLVLASRDQGATWSPPISVVRSSQVVYFQQQLAVDDHGNVGISLFALDAGRVELLFSTARRGSAHFSPPQPVTTQPFDPAPADNGQGQYWLGNYQGLTAGPCAFHPAWVDTRTGSPEIFTAPVLPAS
ncbi:sialidase family protein [Catenulispora rubra]|uniref:sialidase family protein n=1 Tax=Catenulispora rubra TaxID=280293 RepID=UPI001892534E|nr:sialidase family protein [Catenulispora rubra]